MCNEHEICRIMQNFEFSESVTNFSTIFEFRWSYRRVGLNPWYSRMKIRMIQRCLMFPQYGFKKIFWDIDVKRLLCSLPKVCYIKFLVTLALTKSVSIITNLNGIAILSRIRTITESRIISDRVIHKKDCFAFIERLCIEELCHL